jgi:hypothetical protein
MFFLLIFSFSSAFAQYYRTDDMVFKMAVYGASDEIFIWWGHAALIVEHTRWNYSWVFDWGIFTYPSDNFLKEFINDNVQYKCESGSLYFGSYIDEDRDITVYTLNLDRDAKEAIFAYAENNVLEENCYYDYHEFKENCSTRIRDILNLGTGGQLKAAFDSIPGRMSLRQHVQRYTWFRPASNWFAGFLMGQDLDRQITPWDEMFIPIEIARNIVDFSYIDSTGTERRLVSSVEVINSSKTRPPIINEALVIWPFTLGLGLLISALFFYVTHLSKKYPRTGRIFLSISQALLGLFLGASGCVLFLGLFLMNNDYIQQNINILFINPLLLLTVPLGIMSAINKPSRILPIRGAISPERCLRFIWTGVFILCGISMLAWILPFFNQQNQSVVFMITPVAFSLSLVPELVLKLSNTLKKTNFKGVDINYQI